MMLLTVAQQALATDIDVMVFEDTKRVADEWEAADAAGQPRRSVPFRFRYQQKLGNAWRLVEDPVAASFEADDLARIPPDYFAIDFCFPTNTPSALEAVEALQALGQRFFVRSNIGYCPKETDTGWRHSVKTNGKWEIDADHHVRAIYAYDDTATDFLLSPQNDSGTWDHTAAVTIPQFIRERDGNTGQVTTTGGWDILFNKLTASGFDFLPGQRSEYDALYLQYMQGDTLLHELLHVMGARHLEMETDGSGEMFHSVMYPSMPMTGHWGAEVDADLWVDAPVPGRFEVPYGDVYGFLVREFGSTIPADIRIHTWRLFDSGGFVSMGPFGDRPWDGTRPDKAIASSAVCPGHEVTQGYKDSVLEALPGMTGPGGVPLNTSAYLQFWTTYPGGKSIQVIPQMTYDVQGDGVMWRDDMVTIPSMWTFGNAFGSHIQHTTMKGRLFFPSLGIDVAVPVTVTVKRTCGAGEYDSVDDCCCPAEGCSE